MPSTSTSAGMTYTGRVDTGWMGTTSLNTSARTATAQVPALVQVGVGGVDR
jgi:hypothetical protein